MRTKKIPPKRLSPPAEPVAQLIARFTDCSDVELVAAIDAFSEWPWPKSDFFHWIAVLNRFDTILEEAVAKGQLERPQTTPFEPHERARVMAVLKFTLVLWDNCSNRNLYVSYEHLKKLLQSCDLEIVELVLRLLLRPAGRITTQRSLRANLAAFQPELGVLAQHFGAGAQAPALQSLVADSCAIPAEWETVIFRFYHSAPPAAADDGRRRSGEMDAQPASPATPTRPDKAGVPTRIKTQRGPPRRPGAASDAAFRVDLLETDDAVTCTIVHPALAGKPFYEVYRDDVGAEVPDAQRFDLFHRLRMAAQLGDAEQRRHLLHVRLLAISVLASVVNEETARAKIMVYEPDLVLQVTHLLQVDRSAVPAYLQVGAICALESIAHYRSGLPDVLTALNASANHGILMYLLRQVVKELDLPRSSFSSEFVDAFFSFLSFLIETDGGGMALISSGFIQTLVPVLSNHRREHMKNVTRCITMLDNIVNRFTNSINPFANANGLDILVGRIREEVDEVVRQGSDASIPHDKAQFTRAMLKFILHMMQIAGSADHIRNLIETTLPKSLLHVFCEAPAFGAGVFGIAIAILSTFIHNEPTCLSILQDAGLPQALLRACGRPYPVSAEIISALPNAFGAICLNAAGLEMFKGNSPIRAYLRLCASPLALKHLADNDVPSIIGGNVDELSRHHPALKEDVIHEVVLLWEYLVEISAAHASGDDTSLYPVAASDVKGEATAVQGSLSKSDSAEMEDVETQKLDQTLEDPPLTAFLCYMDIVARFSQTLLQNATHAREFIKQGGLQAVVRVATVPVLPYNYESRPAATSIGYVFRVLLEVNQQEATMAVVEGMNACQEALKQDRDLFGSPEGSACAQFVELSDATPPDVVARGNKLVRCLVNMCTFARLISDVFYNHCLSQTKSLAGVCAAFDALSGRSMLKTLGFVHRMTTWEVLTLEARFPHLWKETAADGAARPDEAAAAAAPAGLDEQGSSVSLVEDGDEPVEAATGSSSGTSAADPGKEMAAKNLAVWKYLLPKLANLVTPTFTGIVKTVCSSRRAPEAHQREPVGIVLRLVSEIMRDHLQWPTVVESNAPYRFAYWDVFLNFILALSVDERSRQLQLLFVLSLHREGVLKAVCDTFERFHKEAAVVAAAQRARDAEDVTVAERKTREAFEKRLMTGMRVFLNLATLLMSTKVLSDSPATNRLFSYNSHTGVSDRPAPEDFDYFKQNEHVAAMLVELGPTVQRLWADPCLLQFPAQITRLTIGAVLTILRADVRGASLVYHGPDPGRNRARTNGTSNITPRWTMSDGDAGSLFAQLGVLARRAEASSAAGRTANAALSAARITADPARVDGLVEMGFPRHACERALVACRNNPDLAVEYILSHPEVLEAPSSLEGASGAVPVPEEAAPAPAPAEAAAAEAVEAPQAPQASQASQSASVAVDTAQDDDEEWVSDNGDSDDESDDESEDDSSDDEDMDTERERRRAKRRSRAEMKRQEEKEDERREMLGETRRAAEYLQDELKNGLVARALELLDGADDLVFGVGEMCRFVAADSKTETVLNAFLTDELGALHEKAAAGDEAALAGLSKRYRVLALLANDTALQSALVHAMEPHVFALLDRIVAAPVEGLVASKYRPVWVAPALLLVEAYVSLVDEPRPEELRYVIEGKAPQPLTAKYPRGLEDEQHRRPLLRKVLEFLSTDAAEPDWLEASLRMAARLTRDHALAMELVRDGGLGVLFRPSRIGVYATHQDLTMVLLRHVIEDDATLQQAMEQQIASFFHVPTRTFEIATFLKHHASLACRNPAVFVRAVCAVCRLMSYGPELTVYIGLGSSAPTVEEEKSTEAVPAADTVEPTADAPAEQPETAEGNEGPQNMQVDATVKDKRRLRAEGAEPVVAFLLDTIMAVRHCVRHADDPERLPDASPESPAPPFEARVQRIQSHLQHVLAMQCLAELVKTYPQCRVELLAASQQPAHGATPARRGKAKPNWFLAHLLADVLPYGNVELLTSPSGSSPVLGGQLDERRSQLESSWAIALLTGLCAGVASPELETSTYPEVAQIRRLVFDHIVWAMRDAAQAAEPQSRRYGRYLALVDLTARILMSFASVGPLDSANQKRMGDYKLQCSRLMIERGFVPCLTAMAIDVDAHHPSARVLLDSLVGTLRGLSEQAILLGKELAAPDEALPGAASGPVDDSDDIYDLTRTSALGVFDPLSGDAAAAALADDESSIDDGDGDASNGDIGGDGAGNDAVFSGDDSMSGSDDSHTDDSADDMEIVVPGSYHHQLSDAVDSSGDDSSGPDSEGSDSDDSDSDGLESSDDSEDDEVDDSDLEPYQGRIHIRHAAEDDEWEDVESSQEVTPAAGQGAERGGSTFPLAEGDVGGDAAAAAGVVEPRDGSLAPRAPAVATDASEMETGGETGRLGRPGHRGAARRRRRFDADVSGGEGGSVAGGQVGDFLGNDADDIDDDDDDNAEDDDDEIEDEEMDDQMLDPYELEESLRQQMDMGRMEEIFFGGRGGGQRTGRGIPVHLGVPAELAAGELSQAAMMGGGRMRQHMAFADRMLEGPGAGLRDLNMIVARGGGDDMLEAELLPRTRMPAPAPSVGTPLLLSERAPSSGDLDGGDGMTGSFDLWQPLGGTRQATGGRARGSDGARDQLDELLQQLRAGTGGGARLVATSVSGERRLVGGRGGFGGSEDNPLALLEHVLSRPMVMTVRRIGDTIEVVQTEAAPGSSSGTPPASRGRDVALGAGYESLSPTEKTRLVQLERQVATLAAFRVRSTLQRFLEEAQLFYGGQVHEKARAVLSALYNRLIAAYEVYEAARQREVARQRAAREASVAAARAAWEKAEAERAATEKAAAEKAAAEKAEADRADAERAEAQQAVEPTVEPAAPETEPAEPPAAEQPVEQRSVTVNGRTYDITGTDIDPTFLDALPDDMKEEVIQDQLRQLAAARQRQSGSGPSTTSAAAGAATEENIAALVSSLEDPGLRQMVLMDLHNTPGMGLSPEGQTRIHELMERESQRPPGGFLDMVMSTLGSAAAAGTGSGSGVRAGRPAGDAGPSSGRPGDAAAETAKTVAAARPKEAARMVDRSSLLLLLRLLLLPEEYGRQGMYGLLVNLCENRETRAELVTALAAALGESGRVRGSGSLATPVDGPRAARLLLASPLTSATPEKAAGARRPTPPTLSVAAAGLLARSGDAEEIPFLVEQRCLGALTQIAGKSDANAAFFLSETDAFAQQFAVMSGAGDLTGDSSARTPGASRRHGKAPVGSSTSDVVTLRSPVAVLLQALERVDIQGNSALLESLTALLSRVLRQLGRMVERSNRHRAAKRRESVSAGSLGDVTTNAPAPQTASAESTAETTQKTPAPRPPPRISERGMQTVVRVLTISECSNKTFAYTLAILQSLCALPNARETITRELVDAAQELGGRLVEPLDELTTVLAQAVSVADVQGAAYTKFSSSSSEQAKLLRVVKAIDFILTRSPAAADKTADKAADKDKADAEARAAAELRAIYARLELAPLWERVGQGLAVIGANESLGNIATVLLPLIESFLVVCKPWVPQLHASGAAARPVGDGGAAVERRFLAFTEAHRKILNSMVRNTPSLMSGSFALLVNNPKVLEFDTKRTYFHQRLHKRAARTTRNVINLHVRRDNVFQESFNQMQLLGGDEIKYGKLNIKFRNEEGVDAGGVTREWFSVLSRAMFNPDYAMFKPSAGDKVTYQPNRLSMVHPAHLHFFTFVGRIIGKAVYEGYLLDCYFTRSFYKHILGAPVIYKDMEAIDPDYFKSLEWMLENDITGVLDLTFSVEMDTLGVKETKDLKPNGRNLPVTEANKAEYVQLITEHYLTETIQEQLDAFLRGFHAIVPRDLVAIFNEQELELLISGLPEIDIDDWKNNTDYHNYTPAAPQVQWFWRAVRSFTQEERAKLLQFATGTSKVPLDGFSKLQGVNGETRFNIHRDFKSGDRLPQAHTCFNQLDLPLYDTYEQLRGALLTAISECSAGFGFA